MQVVEKQKNVNVTCGRKKQWLDCVAPSPANTVSPSESTRVSFSV